MFNKGDKLYASNVNSNPTVDNIHCQFLNQSEANERLALCVLENGDVEGFKYITHANCESINPAGDIRVAVECLLMDLVEGKKSNARMLSGYDKIRGLDYIYKAFLDKPTQAEIDMLNPHKKAKVEERSIDLEQIMTVLETAKDNATKLDNILDEVDDGNVNQIHLDQIEEIDALIEAFSP